MKRGDVFISVDVNNQTYGIYQQKVSSKDNSRLYSDIQILQTKNIQKIIL